MHRLQRQVLDESEARVKARMEEFRERIEWVKDRGDRKAREVSEEVAGVRANVEQIRGKQQYHERQISQVTGLITSKPL